MRDVGLPVNWGSLKTVRAFRRRQCFKALRDISLAELPKSAWWKGIPDQVNKECLETSDKTIVMCLCSKRKKVKEIWIKCKKLEQNWKNKK